MARRFRDVRLGLRVVLTAGLVVGASVGFSGCASSLRVQPSASQPGVTVPSPVIEPLAGKTCLSWAAHETPQDAFDGAKLVVLGRVAPAHTTRSVFGHRAVVHEVTVAQVLKGDADVKEPLEVASTPITCTGDEVYPEGDPLDVAGDVVLFLTDGEVTGEWRLLTPFEGVLAVGPDGGPPPLDAW